MSASPYFSFSALLFEVGSDPTFERGKTTVSSSKEDFKMEAHENVENLEISYVSKQR